LLFGCTDNTSDCLSSAGNTISKTIVLNDFSKVIFHEGIELEIKQGTENSIQIDYGENLLKNISTTITNGVLSIDNSSCNLIRDIKPAKVVLTAITISEIRNASQFLGFSKNILRFNSLTLISENHNTNYVNVDDFSLRIENKNLDIISNNVSNFKITGSTESLFVGFYAGESKFNGKKH